MYKYTIWKLEDESIYTVNALKVKSTSSLKEARTYWESITDCIITFFDPSDRDEMNAQHLRDISEQLFATE